MRIRDWLAWEMLAEKSGVRGSTQGQGVGRQPSSRESRGDLDPVCQSARHSGSHSSLAVSLSRRPPPQAHMFQESYSGGLDCPRFENASGTSLGNRDRRLKAQAAAYDLTAKQHAARERKRLETFIAICRCCGIRARLLLQSFRFIFFGRSGILSVPAFSDWT